MPTKTHTPEEYFKLDEAAPEGVRLEYFDGTIYHQGRVFEPSNGWNAARALAGASPEHSRIKHNIEWMIGSQLRGRDCDIFSSDQRVEVKTKSGYVYPDIVVTCDPRYDRVTLQSPELLIEILSKSTRRYDLTKKKEAYATIPTVKEYWFISSKDVEILKHTRTGETWTTHYVTDLNATLESPHFPLTLPANEIYHRVF